MRSETGFRPPPDWDNRFSILWHGLGRTEEQISEMAWMGSRPGLLEGGRRQAYYSGFAAGWPLRSLAGTDSMYRGDAAWAPPPMVAVPTWLLKGGWRLPVSPMWTGFVVDTLLWGAVVWGVVKGVPAWKRWSRRRRGLCEACGYPVTNLERCPECGRSKPSVGVSETTRAT